MTKKSTFVGLSILILGACHEADKLSVNVGGQRFDVPSEYLPQGTVPWAPSSSEKSIVFIANPKAKLQDQIVVVFEDRGARCKDSAALPDCEGPYYRPGARLERREPRANDFGWDYVEVLPDEKERTVISCLPLGGSKSRGVCNTLVPFGNRAYLSLRFSSRQITKLDEIVRICVNLLNKWKSPT